MRRLREEQGLTTYEVEQQTRLSRHNLASLERGEHLSVSDKVLKKLAPLYKVNYEFLKAHRIINSLTKTELEELRRLLCDCE